MSLVEESEKRKARLAALRQARDQSGGALNQDGEKKVLNFRNYQPIEDLDKAVIDESGNLDNIRSEIGKVEQKVSEFAKNAIEEEKGRSTAELDLLNIQPKKPNWDLKRDLEQKMAALNRKTNVAIADLIRERLKSQKDVGDFTAAEVDRQLNLDDPDY